MGLGFSVARKLVTTLGLLQALIEARPQPPGRIPTPMVPRPREHAGTGAVRLGCGEEGREDRRRMGRRTAERRLEKRAEKI